MVKLSLVARRAFSNIQSDVRSRPHKRIAERDKALYSQINFDFSEIGDPNNINEKKINIDKIIGMLTVFKFYRTFLEKFFNAVRIQDTLREKIAELNSEANYIEAIFRSSE